MANGSAALHLALVEPAPRKGRPEAQRGNRSRDRRGGGVGQLGMRLIDMIDRAHEIFVGGYRGLPQHGLIASLKRSVHVIQRMWLVRQIGLSHRAASSISIEQSR